MELIRKEDGTLQCSECGTRLRPGQPHSAVEPVPHQTLEALVVYAPELAEEVTR